MPDPARDRLAPGVLTGSAGADLDGPLVRLAGIGVTFATNRGLFRRGQVRALDGVDAEIRRGEALAIVGESGSGKTTLGRVSLRLVDPTAGTVAFDGRDISQLPAGSLSWFRQRAQIIFQDPFSSLNPSMRVRDLVEEPLVIDGMRHGSARWERVRNALEAVDLAPAVRFGARYPGQLSGGQRQRVGIARALVREPDYIVADEPVSMIDASSRIEILQLLRGLQSERRVAFMSITHDLASARYFSDRIAVMYLGQVMEEGPTATVIDRPLHPYTRALVAAVPEPDPANRFRRREVVPAEQSGLHHGVGCPFFSRCPERIPGTCDLIRPILADQGRGQRVACHLYPGATPPQA